MKKILYAAAGIGMAAGLTALYIENKEAVEKGKKYHKFKKYYQVLNQWVANLDKGITNEKILEEMGIASIAVYGNGEIGNRLVESLKNTSVNVECIIEKKAEDFNISSYDEVTIVSVKDTDKYADVDAVIITPMFDIDTIIEEIREQGITTRLISIEELVYSDI